MTSAALEAYLSRLEREFWMRGLQCDGAVSFDGDNFLPRKS